MAWDDVAVALRVILTEATGRTAEVVIRGVKYDCWRCDRVTEVPLVLHLDESCNPQYCFSVDDEGVLPYVRELLTVAGHSAAGLVKTRYSRTRQERYQSLGCQWCDALFGMFPLGERYISVAAADAIESLPVMVRLERPALEWWTLEGLRSNV